MAQNKIITSVSAIVDNVISPTENNVVCIDTRNSRIGVKKSLPLYEIDVIGIINIDGSLINGSNIIDSSGYFIASAGSFENKIKDKSKIKDYVLNNKDIFISIEPNFDEKVDFDDEYLYHTTDKKNLDKILSVGLIPKSKNTRSFYPERVYLSPSLQYMDSIKYQLNTNKPAEYVFLKIKNYDGLSLYKDVRFKGGFYTYDNISPKYIEVLEN
jgi:hypothetical protein